MATSRERDESVERMLRQTLRASPQGEVTGSCLDVETLAAWVDGSLRASALLVAEAHAADCARCQSLVGAMVRTAAAVEPAAERVQRRWLAWLVPLTAAAAVVTLWVIVPLEPRATRAPASPVTDGLTQAADTPSPAEVPTPPPAGPGEPPQAAAAPERRAPAEAPGRMLDSQPPGAELKKEQVGRLEADALPRRNAAEASAASAGAAALPVVPTPPSAAGLPEAPPATLEASRARTAQTGNAVAERAAPRFEIVSPDPLVRWRVGRPGVERSTSGGSNWDPVPTGVAADLTAGAAPSPTVCWLVGRAGVVLLSTDGRTWRRLPFPEATDLASVRAADARTASVSAADGRVFSTSDGGVTWDRR